jgi:hypothetical protein
MYLKVLIAIAFSCGSGVVSAQDAGDESGSEAHILFFSQDIDLVGTGRWSEDARAVVRAKFSAAYEAFNVRCRNEAAIYTWDHTVTDGTTITTALNTSERLWYSKIQGSLKCYGYTNE